MQVLPLIFLHFLFCSLFAMLEGVRDGGTFAYGCEVGKKPYNIHLFFLPVRALFWAGSTVGTVYFLGWIGWALAASQLLEFCFSHNGAYYETRRRIDYPAYRWTSKSTTTTARFSLGFWGRTALFVAGLAVRGVVWWV